MENNHPEASTIPPITQPIQAPPSSKPKWILILIPFLFILLISLGGIYYLSKNKEPQKATPLTQTATSTPNPTVGWKTYINKDYGFSFKYPSKFTITETTEKPTYQGIYNENINRYSLEFSTNTLIDNIEDFSGFSVDVGPTLGMTLNQYYKGLTPNGDPWIIKYVSPYGNASEAAQIVCYSCSNTTERFGNYFYSIIPFQNAATLPDGSDDIWTYKSQVFSTFNFTQ